MSAKRAAQGAGTIRKKIITKNGKQYEYWEARVTVGRDPGTGKQIQRSFSGKTQKEVRQKLQSAAVDLDAGTYQTPEKITVAQWLKIWEAEYLGSIKPTTVRNYHSHIVQHIIPALGAIRLQELTTPQIQQFYNKTLKEGGKVPKHDDDGNIIRKNGKVVYESLPLSPKTIKNIHGIFHKALRQAVEIGYLRFNPAEACKLPRYVRPPITPLDEDQIQRFLEEIRGNPFEDLFTVALFTGLRQGEAFGLLWECVDFQKGILLIDKQLQRRPGGQNVFAPTKNDHSRTIRPAPWVMNLLRRHKYRQLEDRFRAAEFWEESGLVFTDSIGHNLNGTTVNRYFKKAVTAIGCPNVRFHDLRHSYAVASIRAGDDIKTVQENLGHATAAFTLDVYGHVTEQMKQASAERMQTFIKSVLNL